MWRPAVRALTLSVFLLACVSALAGLIPKFLKQIPRELHGGYFLLLQMNPDQTKHVFTNPPPFATIASNQIALAAGDIKSVKRLMQVTQKGTNVYLISFQDESS